MSGPSAIWRLVRCDDGALEESMKHRRTSPRACLSMVEAIRYNTNNRTYLSIGIVRCTLSDEKIALECMSVIYKYCTWVAKI